MSPWRHHEEVWERAWNDYLRERRTTHFKIVCTCGRIISQCKCIRADKPVITLEHPACTKPQPGPYERAA